MALRHAKTDGRSQNGRMDGAAPSSRSVTRRGFLKTTGALAGVAAFAGTAGGLKAASAAPTPSAEEVKSGICRGTCIGGCHFKQTVRDGKLVRSEMAPMPDVAYNRICSKGMSHAQRTYSPDRIQYPMRRVEGTPRGGGEWERISWEEAIDEIATKWKGYIDEYGARCIGYCSNHLQTQTGEYIRAMANLIGFSLIGNQGDQAGVYTIAQYLNFGKFMFCGNEAADIVNARNIFLFGCNGAISFPHNATFIWEAKKRGARVVAIDPNHTPTVAAFADRHVPVRMATDACLFMGMCHAVIEENLTDEAFLKERTVAPFLVKKSDGTFLRREEIDPAAAAALAALSEEEAAALPPYGSVLVMTADGTTALATEASDPLLSGSFVVNGIEVVTVYDRLMERLAEWPMDKCSEICGISEDEIRELARQYADGPTTALIHYGADHYTNGHTGYEALITLAALTGNLLKRGACVGQGGNIASLGLAGAAAWGAAKAEGAVATVAANGTVDGALNPSYAQFAEYVREGTVNGKPLVEGDFAFRSWWMCGGNPVAGAVNRQEVLDALESLDLIVCQDIVWSEPAQNADIVLPAAYYTEYDDYTLGSGFSAPFVIWQDKCVEPAYEAKTDYEIVHMLVEALGYGDLNCESHEEWLRFGIEQSANAQAAGITLDRLREEGACKILPYPEDGGTYIEDTLNTPSGRVEFYQEIPVSNNAWPGDYDVDLERMMYWEPPYEAWPYDVAGYGPSEAAQKYPLNFHWRRSRFATHTNFGVGNHWLDEIDPEPFIRINRADGEARGIADGDLVRVYNDRGYCIIRAYLDSGLAAGCIDSPQRYQGHQYREGSMIDLPNSKTHPFINNAVYNECQVEVEKYEEA